MRPSFRLRLIRLAAPLALAFLPACGADGPTAPHPVLRVTTDGARYGRGATVRVTVENVGGKAVALGGCPQPPSAYLDRRDGGGWETTAEFGTICLAIYATRVVTLAPGGRLQFTFDAARTGDYRLRVLGRADLRYPDAVGVSDTFVVE